MHSAAQSGSGGSERNAFLVSWRGDPLVPGSCKYSPPFPALPNSLVRLEILLQSRVVDLQKVVGVVRCDPGLAAEILRLSGRRGQDTPCRLHECIVHLGTRSLSRAVRIVPSWACAVAHEDVWYLRWRLKRARLTALAAESISASLGDIPAEQAYLAGLLHDLPGMICLDRECACKSPGTRLNSWNLPACAAEVIRWHHKPGYAAPHYSALVQRVAAARAWVDEIELTDTSLPLGWLHSVSRKPTWRTLPNRGAVLRALADELNHWRMNLPS